jgi:hypothetical protein
VDDTGVRALLARVADEPAPPSRVDIAAARQRGRRRIRWHRAALAAAPLAAAAAVALVVSGIIPATLGFGPGGPGGLRPGPETARSRFSPLQPYAAFGWLPAGFSTAAGAAMASANQDQATTLSATLVAGDRATGRLLTLTVSAAGACQFTGPLRASVLVSEDPPRLMTKTYPHGLRCSDGTGHRVVTPLRAAAPGIGGGSAFYLPSGGLAWEYAPGSWASLTPSAQSPGGRDRLHRMYQAAAGWAIGPGPAGFPATIQSAASRALVRKVAERVSYGATAHIVFPFQLAGRPAGWTVSTASYVPAGGRLLGTGGLQAGPARYPYALYAGVRPAGTEGKCTINRGQGRFVRVHGAPATLYPNVLNSGQALYVCDIGGLYVNINLFMTDPKTHRQVPGTSLGALAIARRMRLLGTDPAAWTTDPLG